MAPRPFDPDLCALLACALAPAEADLSAALKRVCGGRFPSARILERATLHQVRPQLAAQVRRLDAPAGGLVGAELTAFAEAHRGRGLLMAGELARVLDGLRAAGVVSVPFKGPVFAALVGQGAGSREMTDLDLLVRPTDVVDAVRALAPLGYRPMLPPQAIASSWLTRVTPELALVGHHGTMLIELHWQLSQSWYAAPCTVDDMMSRLTERDVLGGRIRWPAAEELFLLHVADGMKSCGNGLRWIADVAHVLRGPGKDLDWAHVARLAARHGGLNSVRVALAVADDLSSDLARMLDYPALALVLPPLAQALAADARRVNRLSEAIQSIRQRLAADEWLRGTVPQFLWALRLADRPARVARAIVRYLADPTLTDLAAMSARGESGARLRWRASWRRAAWAWRPSSDRHHG